METRKFHNLIVIGTIEALSDDGLSAQIRIGDIVTDMRPLPAAYGQNFTANRPVLDTAQVILNCPSGALENSVIIGFLWSNDIQPYTTERHIDGVKFTDGTKVEYDSITKEVRVNTAGRVIVETADSVIMSSHGDIELKADGALKLQAGQIEILGPVTQTGGDMTSDGISAQNHIHTETGVKTQGPE